jgi:hypothetical protein
VVTYLVGFLSAVCMTRLASVNIVSTFSQKSVSTTECCMGDALAVLTYA